MFELLFKPRLIFFRHVCFSAGAKRRHVLLYLSKWMLTRATEQGRDPREPDKLKQDSAGGTVRGLYESPALHTAARQATANEAAQWRAQREAATLLFRFFIFMHRRRFRSGSPDDPRTRPLVTAMPVSLSTSRSRAGEGWRQCPRAFPGSAFPVVILE
jgi:hypothetical protein